MRTDAGGQMALKTVRTCLMDGRSDTLQNLSTLGICTEIQSTPPQISLFKLPDQSKDDNSRCR